MKKFLVVLLALACLSTLVYAEGSTVGFGWGRVQFNAVSGSSASGSEMMTGWAGPSTGWPPAPRENLGLAYSGDFTSFQLTAYLDGTVLSWVNINGTLNLVPDMFKVMIGEFNGDGFDAFRKTSPHPIRDVNNANVGRMNGWGIIADLAPKDSGLEAAVFIQTGDPTAASSIATLTSTIGNTEVGASYTLPGMLKVAAGAVVGNLYNAGAIGYDRVIFGRVELLMVPNLTLWADVAYDGFDWSPTTVSNINAELAAGYSMEAIGIAFAGKFGTNDDTVTKVMTWAVYPEVWYDAGAITAGLYASVAGDDVANSGISYGFEPWVKLDDFNLRVSFHYMGSTASGAISTWEVPILITWGF